MSGMQVVIVTPESTVLDRKAEFVAVPLIDGEIGILVGHSPMIGRMGFGELRVREGDDSTRYYVDGGFVQVADNVVSVLTGSAMPVSRLNATEIRNRLTAAESKTGSATGSEAALLQQAISRAKTQLRILEKA